MLIYSNYSDSNQSNYNVVVVTKCQLLEPNHVNVKSSCSNCHVIFYLFIQLNIIFVI